MVEGLRAEPGVSAEAIGVHVSSWLMLTRQRSDLSPPHCLCRCWYLFPSLHSNAASGASLLCPSQPSPCPQAPHVPHSVDHTTGWVGSSGPLAYIRRSCGCCQKSGLRCLSEVPKMTSTYHSGSTPGLGDLCVLGLILP